MIGESAHIEVAVRAEGHTDRPAQIAAVCHDEVTEKGAVYGIEQLDLIGTETGDQQITHRGEGQPVWITDVVRCVAKIDPDGAVVALDLPGSCAADIEIAVRAERQPGWSEQSATARGDKTAQISSCVPVVALHIV